MAEFIKPFFNPYVQQERHAKYFMPINRCLHIQKGHSHRLEDQHTDCQINTPVVMYLLQPMKMITYCRTCTTVSHKISYLKSNEFTES